MKQNKKRKIGSKSDLRKITERKKEKGREFFRVSCREEDTRWLKNRDHRFSGKRLG